MSEKKDLECRLKTDYVFGETPIQAYFRWRDERYEAAAEIERLKKIEIECEFIKRYLSKGE